MSASSTTAPTPAQELATLVSQATSLAKIALDMSKLVMEINDAIPRVIIAQVDAAVAAVQPAPPQFVRGVARTPAQMEAAFPQGLGEYQPWYVVIVGREPGLYGSSLEADTEVTGIPGQFRQKKSTRTEALAFYRNRYEANTVIKITEVPVAAIAAPATAVAASAVAAPAAVAPRATQ